MKIFIDQSGRVEYTSHNTIVAFSNGKQKAIKILARTKRQLQEIFRRKGAPNLFVYRTFATLIFLLVKNELCKIKQIVIDIEYPGQDKLIKDILLELIRKNHLNEPEISFQKIGNKPKVHYAAYDVFIQKKKASQVINLEEISCLAIKK
jgi:hypothetical protein